MRLLDMSIDLNLTEMPLMGPLRELCINEYVQTCMN